MSIVTELLKMKKKEIHDLPLDEFSAENLAYTISHIYGPTSLKGFEIDIRHEEFNILDQLEIMWRLNGECISTSKFKIKSIMSLVAFYFIDYIVVAYIPLNVFKYGLLNMPLADKKYIEKLVIYNVVRGEIHEKNN